MKKTAEAVSSETVPSADIRLAAVPAGMVQGVWPHVRDILQPAIDRSGGRLDEPSVLDGLLKRDMQLWLALEYGISGAAVTQVCVHPTGMKTLSALLVAGKDFHKWSQLWGGIEDWARSKGCARSEIPRGRKGWTKVLKGWDEMTFMEKEL